MILRRLSPLVTLVTPQNDLKLHGSGMRNIAVFGFQFPCCVGCHPDRNSVTPRPRTRFAVRDEVQELERPRADMPGFTFVQ